MATITSRSLPMVSLPLNISIANGDSSSIHSDIATRMTVTNRPGTSTVSPRLMSPKDERLSSPLSRYSGDGGSPKNHHTPFSDIDRLQMDPINRRNCTNSTLDDMSDARSSSVSSYQADSFNREPEDDRMSCCSDDSELSVGKEGDGEREQFCDNNSDERHSEKIMRAESVDSESVDDADESCDTPLQDRSDDLSNESSRFNILPHSPRDEIVKFPIIRPSPTRLQEEFLRNSQLYAEELMKQQMSFMAATKVLNLNPKLNEFGFPIRSVADDTSSVKIDDPKLGFRPHIRLTDNDQRWNAIIDDRSTQSPEGMNFRGIHSHLNAISKITSALGRDMANLTSPGSITSRESSQSPPNHLQQLINNNIINDSNLKFSIDNILKPGFGRRITDPLLKRNKCSKKVLGQRSQLNDRKHGTPMDLTATTIAGGVGGSSVTTSTTTTATVRSTESPVNKQQQQQPQQDKVSTTVPSIGSTSSSPQSWPAWVYCTRYSDRPSSGKQSAHIWLLFNFFF